MAHPQLDLASDDLLRTTRAVRKRLDLDRDVPLDVVRECLELAVQAPSASNSQGWQFMVVTDPAKRARIGELYEQAFSVYRTMPIAIHHLHGDSPSADQRESQVRSIDSAEYLATNMKRVPVMLIPCIEGRIDQAGGMPGMLNLSAASAMGSILPATWSFMLAARARGLGTAWTTLHLMHEKEIADLLGIPFERYAQVALIAVAYTRGTDFKPAYRPPVDTVMHVNAW